MDFNLPISCSNRYGFPDVLHCSLFPLTQGVQSNQVKRSAAVNNVLKDLLDNHKEEKEGAKTPLK